MCARIPCAQSTRAGRGAGAAERSRVCGVRSTTAAAVTGSGRGRPGARTRVRPSRSARLSTLPEGRPVVVVLVVVGLHYTQISDVSHYQPQPPAATHFTTTMVLCTTIVIVSVKAYTCVLIRPQVAGPPHFPRRLCALLRAAFPARASTRRLICAPHRTKLERQVGALTPLFGSLYTDNSTSWGASPSVFALNKAWGPAPGA